MSGGRQYYNNIKGNNDYWFVKAGYDIDKFGFGAGYTQGKGYSWALGKERAKETNGLLMLATSTAKNLHSFLGMQLLKIKKTAKALNKIVSDLKQNIASKNNLSERAFARIF